MTNDWEKLYYLLGISDFMNFISSPEIQNTLLPIKIVFILFTVFFFCAVMYFYFNSSYIRFHFLQDNIEFFSWQPYGLRQINKTWQRIMKRIETGSEVEYKIAIVEADDFLYKLLEDKGYEGETFEELLGQARLRIESYYEQVLAGHEIRNSIVYNSDYKLDTEVAKDIILSSYEKAIKNI